MPKHDPTVAGAECPRRFDKSRRRPVRSWQPALALLWDGTDDSAVVERERLRASYLVMLGRLADIARRDHDYSSALEYASLVLKYDAAREDAHRTLMCCYALLGERVQAMRQYLLCERLLQEAFDAVPEAATRELYDRLRLSPGGVLEESVWPPTSRWQASSSGPSAGAHSSFTQPQA